MAKKIRFPLEMENGVSVRDLDELKDNFSLARVIGYINDGKLITWLQDRYENELAEEVKKINVEAEDAAKKISELFDVEYDETAEEEVEKAEERKRKLELLKKFPDRMEYAKYIDLVAFDQDDLYDLLDENVNEIYLCGNKFTIPIAKGNIKYVGILDKVTVVINSKEPVNFNSRGIIFENCVFDEKYAGILNGKKNNTKKKISEEVKENSDDYDVDLEGVDADELHDFYEDIMETIVEFADKEFENEYVELYEYDNSIECDADDYNDGGFATKAKAKAACKAELTKAIADVKKLYESAKKELIDAAEIYYADMRSDLITFLKGDFFDSYEALIGVYCTGKTKEYLEKKINRLKGTVNCWEIDINKLYEGAFELTVKEDFEAVEKDSMNEKEIFEMCEYDVVEESYSFCMDDACEKLVSMYKGIIETEESDFPIDLRDAYNAINDKYVTLLKTSVFDDKYGKIVADEEMKNGEGKRSICMLPWLSILREGQKISNEEFLNRLTDYLKK